MTSISDILRAERYKKRSVLVVKPWNPVAQDASMFRAQYWAILHGKTHLVEVPVREMNIMISLLDELQPLAKGWTTYIEVEKRALCSGMTLDMLGRNLQHMLRYDSRLLFSEKAHLKNLAEALCTPVSSHDHLAAIVRLSRGEFTPHAVPAGV